MRENEDWGMEIERQQYEQENKMGLMVKKPENNFELAPEGNHVAICYQVIDLGFQKSVWNGQENFKHKVFMNFELCNELMESGKPFSVGARFTLSLHEKAELRKSLESWRGRKFTDQELEGFDLFNILGKPCMVNVQHSEGYANIMTIAQIPKGLQTPDRVNPLLSYSLQEPNKNRDKLPEWALNKINFETQDYEPPQTENPRDEYPDVPF